MEQRISRREFERMVERALAALPAEFRDRLDNVVVRIEDEPPADMPDVMGLYEGVPLVERSSLDFLMPDCITVFQGPIQRACASRTEIQAEIGVTVLHEVGHFFGLGEQQLEELERRLERGWER